MVRDFLINDPFSSIVQGRETGEKQTLFYMWLAAVSILETVLELLVYFPFSLTEAYKTVGVFVFQKRLTSLSVTEYLVLGQLSPRSELWGC